MWYNARTKESPGVVALRSDMNVKRLVRPNIKNLTAYQAKEVPCAVKLDANESPFGVNVEQRILRRIETNRYPDPEGKALKQAIARNLGVEPAQILLGNGSDELISYLIVTFGGPVLYPVPTFSMYGIIAQALDEPRIAVPLDGAFDLDLASIRAEIRNRRPKLIFLSSPNNPTGNCFSAEKILRVIELVKGRAIVILDEAYQPFAGTRGFLPLLRDYEHLVIIRSLSKIGLAGIRVGFLIAREEIVEEVNKVRLPFNVNAISQAIAVHALTVLKSSLKRTIGTVVTERERLFRELSKIPGVRPYPTEANFILFEVDDAEGVYRRLLKKGILVRNMRGVVDGCLRVTVGTPDENRVFLNTLKRVLR